MQSRILCCLFLLVYAGRCWGQSVSGISSPIRMEVGKERSAGKPGLAYTHVELRDENNNKTIEAWEKAAVVFTIRNVGKGPSQNLIVSAFTENDTEVKGLLYSEPLTFDSLAPGKSQEVSIPVEGSLQLNAGIASITIQIREEYEYSPDQIEINVLTAEFQPPKLNLASSSLETDNSRTGDVVMATLKLVVENKGAGPASDTRLDLFLPNFIKQIDPPAFVLNHLEPGESKRVNFRFYISPDKLKEEIPVRALIIERHQKYGQDATFKIRKSSPR